MRRGVIKVARRGFDIRYAQPRNLTVDSTTNQFKVYMEGGGVTTMGDGVFRREIDIAHNLGYQPAYLVYTKKPDGKIRLTPFVGDSSNFVNHISTGIDRLDDNKLRLYIYSFDPSLSSDVPINIEYKYIIFVDPNKHVWDSED